MIEIKGLTKRFDKVVAVDHLDLRVTQGSVTGLVGSNGSGKSTLLRMLAGVFRGEEGDITLDGMPLFDNPAAKGECFFIPDFPFFYMLYRELYPNWSDAAYQRYCSVFPIKPKDRIINMSKGMQRQAALILALSTCPKYLFLDEIFDGLDPVVRHLLKRILIEHVAEHRLTVIIASHNLRELEDLCDRICLMHRGKVLMERDIDSLRMDYRKVQVAFREVPNVPNLFAGMPVVSVWRNGNVFNVTIRGDESSFMPALEALQPAYISAMPLTLEEIFISEMGAAGYDTNSVL